MTYMDIFAPLPLLLLFCGTMFGLVFGAIPGLTGSTALALILPITYTMTQINSVTLLIGTFIGGLTGGLVSAILLRIPGTAASIATVFDGYPLAQKGQASRALGTAVFASFVGGVFSTIILMYTAPLLAELSIEFGPYEYFAISMFALSIVSFLIKGNPLKGVIACVFGLFLACVGSSPIDGKIRLTMGFTELNGGFEFLSMMIGLFAFSELFRIFGRFGKEDDPKPMQVDKNGQFLPTRTEIWENKTNLLRSCCIGTGIGILPGMGGSIAGMLAYVQAKKYAKRPEEFGNGSIEGIMAVESSNNAVTGGALIPMLTLGIPGESVSALLMSGLAIQGFTMGPMLFIQSPDVITTFIACVFLANFAMFGIMLFANRWFCSVLRIPGRYLYPFIMVVCFIGIYGATYTYFDLPVALFFGVIGYFFDRNDYPVAPFVLSLILGTMVETNFRKTIIYYGTFQGAFAQWSVGNVILIITIVILALSVGLKLRQAHIDKKTKGEPSNV